jgi:hypothetical protein
LTSLRLGSIGAQLGETINEFSSDALLTGNSNSAIPTEYAVKTYVDAAKTAAQAYADSAAGAISVNTIPFVSSISSDETSAGSSMRFSMETLTVDNAVTYTIPTGSYHFVLNPNGLALFQ